MQHGEIRIKNETLTVLEGHVISRGVPLPPGAVTDEKGVSVADAEGRAIPCEGTVLQRRTDGSVEWMLLDILLDLGAQEEKSIFVGPRPAQQPEIAQSVTVSEEGPLVTLANGVSEIAVSREGGSLIQRLTINGKTLVDETARVDLEVVDGGGKIHRASLSGPYAVTVPHRNRLRTTVKIEGKHTARDTSTFLDFALRLTLTAGCPDLELEHTFYCREDQEGKIPVKAIRLVVPTTMDGGAKKMLRQSHHGHTWFPRAVEIAENVEIVASSVGDIDNYNQQFKGPGVSHPCAGGGVFIRNADSLHEDWSEYPFHMRPEQGSGFRADIGIGGLRRVTPVIGWKEKDFTLVTTFGHFRQLHPKSINIDENVVTYSIWPEWSIPMQIVQGVSKSHLFWITGEPRELSMHEVESCHHRWEHGYVEPLDISFDPAWPAFCEVVECEHSLRYQPDKYPLLENLIEPVPSAGNPARHTYDRQSATIERTSRFA